MDPVHLGENEDKRKLIRIAANGELAGDFRMSLLCLLSRADALGAWRMTQRIWPGASSSQSFWQRNWDAWKARNVFPPRIRREPI